ncbi:hypothetical protein EON63_23850 [archaeon]|nr:MAG: hypothetical protein EON63_23850 [archaeon]
MLFEFTTHHTRITHYAGPLSAEQTRKSIEEIYRLTDKPFGIGKRVCMIYFDCCMCMVYC